MVLLLLPSPALRLALLYRHELLQAAAGLARIAAGGQPAEDVPQLVGCQALGPGALDEVLQRSILRAADPDAVLPARVANRVAAAFRRIVGSANPVVRLRVGHDERVVLENPDAAGTAELRPRIDHVHVLVEDLDAVVRAIGDDSRPFESNARPCGPRNSPGFRPCRPY